MKKLLKYLLGIIFLLGLGGGFYFFKILPVNVDNKMNVVYEHAPYQVSQAAKDLHARLRVADLHADTLLWKRDPSKRQSRGQTDFPRLREGGVAVQVFATVTFVPKGLNEKSNTSDNDQMVLLTLAQGWPKRTRHSTYERALYQSERLHKAQASSNGNFVIAKSKTGLAAALAKRENSKDILIGMLATEGAHPLEGKIENLDTLYGAGFRMIGLQHFFDNKLGGSLHGVSKAGLTPFGKQVVKAIVGKGMMIDVAHSSVKTVEDVLAPEDVHNPFIHRANVSRNRRFDFRP